MTAQTGIARARMTLPITAVAATAALALLGTSPLRAGLLQSPIPAVAGGAPAFDVISIK